MTIKNRAYSVLSFKAIDEDDENYHIEGTATTPRPDRVGDIVEPMGAKFSIPMPLLWQHNRDKPVGQVTLAKPTKKGIPFKATLPKVLEAGSLRDRIEEAVQSIKYKLVAAVSIGFRAVKDKYEFMEDGGIRFNEWEWLELSLVTIPANSDAKIKSLSEDETMRTFREIDKGILAASGIDDPEIDRPEKPKVGVTTKKTIGKVKLIKPEEGSNMNLAEKIKEFRNTRAAKVAEMRALIDKSAESGETLDADEAENYDTLKGEVAQIDEHLKRLEDMMAMEVNDADPVDDRTGMQGKTATVPQVTPRVKVKEDLGPGIEFARYVMCLGAAKGDLSTAAAIAEKRFPHSERINLTLKAAVAAGTTTDTDWASALVEYNQFAGDFVNYLRPKTILGKFGTGNIPNLRQIPFNIHIRGQTSGGSGYWVGQGQPKPLTKFNFEDAYLGFAKVANIAVLTQELMRFSNPAAEGLVRDALAEALMERMDTDFIDPTKSSEANVSPASITYNVTQNQASGTDADAVRADVKTLMDVFIAANITPSSGVWIMSESTALTLSLMRNALGQKEFPDITMLGGMFEGLPVITSQFVANDSDGAFIHLVNATDIWIADDGQVVIDASREASLQMLDNPTNNSADGTATTMVSMFQTNSVAIRAERWVNWQKRRSAAVAVLAGVNYAV